MGYKQKNLATTYFSRALLGLKPSRIIRRQGDSLRYAMPHHPSTHLRVLHRAPLSEAVSSAHLLQGICNEPVRASFQRTGINKKNLATTYFPTP